MKIKHPANNAECLALSPILLLTQKKNPRSAISKPGIPCSIERNLSFRLQNTITIILPAILHDDNLTTLLAIIYLLMPLLHFIKDACLLFVGYA